MRKMKSVILLCLLLGLHLPVAAEPVNPLLLNHSLYVSAQGIFKFDANNLQAQWSSLIGITTFDPVFDGSRLLVGSTQGLYALDPQNGDILWRIEARRTLFTPSVSASLYAGSLHGELYSIEPAQGRIEWKRLFPGWIYSPAIDERSSSLWSGGQAHKLYALSKRDGSLLREINTAQELIFSPVNLGNQRIAANLFDGSTLILQAPNGEIAGSLTGRTQAGSIYRYHERIYRADRDGSLSAFGFDDFALRWRRSLLPGDLGMHPAQPGFLLLSDLDQNIILFDLRENSEIQRIHPRGKWTAPVQLDSGDIVYFKILLQPPWLVAVKAGYNRK